MMLTDDMTIPHQWTKLPIWRHSRTVASAGENFTLVTDKPQVFDIFANLDAAEFFAFARDIAGKLGESQESTMALGENAVTVTVQRLDFPLAPNSFSFT